MSQYPPDSRIVRPIGWLPGPIALMLLLAMLIGAAGLVAGDGVKAVGATEASANSNTQEPRQTPLLDPSGPSNLPDRPPASSPIAPGCGPNWVVEYSPNPGGSYDNLSAVTAVSASDVWAVGDYVSNGA